MSQRKTAYVGHSWANIWVATSRHPQKSKPQQVRAVVLMLHLIGEHTPASVTYTRPQDVAWHIWHNLIICGQPLGNSNRALSVCVDSHSSYELRLSMCTFRYIHITNMHPCRYNQNVLAWTENFEIKHNRGDKGVCSNTASLHTPKLPPSVTFSPLLVTTVPQRALWRAPLYSPAHHHA